VDEASAVNGNKYVDALREATKNENAEILIVAAKIESEIAEFETYEERQMFLEEIGLEESAVVTFKVIHRNGHTSNPFAFRDKTVIGNPTVVTPYRFGINNP
jgi:ribosome-binding ATPase YchF (GTP1/OBG family)